MRLAAMNESVAIFSLEGKVALFERKKALSALTKVKKWKDVISFLNIHCSNRAVAWAYYESEEQSPFYNAPDFGEEALSGNLAKELKPLGIEYLDGTTELPANCRAVSIKELIHVRDSVRRLARLACIATASDEPIDSCSLIDGLIEWPYESSLSINLEKAGVTEGGLFHIDPKTKYGFLAHWTYQTALDYRKPSMIKWFDLNEDAGEWVEAGERRESEEAFSFAIIPSKTDTISTDEAVRRVCGYTVSLMLNANRRPFETKLLAPPYTASDRPNEKSPYRENAMSHLRYSTAERAFTRPTGEKSPSPWYEQLAQEAFEAVYDGRCMICRHCGTPFVSERSTKRFCSESCKTLDKTNPAR